MSVIDEREALAKILVDVFSACEYIKTVVRAPITSSAEIQTIPSSEKTLLSVCVGADEISSPENSSSFGQPKSFRSLKIPFILTAFFDVSTSIDFAESFDSDANKLLYNLRETINTTNFYQLTKEFGIEVLVGDIEMLERPLFFRPSGVLLLKLEIQTKQSLR